ncbi:hypothetical protein HBO15_05945 [Pseudomonas sp. WS 5111]|jgi:hypothetical protein|uniref:hypothetical protein n=1 Tax=unclassified Pseudomonas TaxID=196821 RepID=UPI0014735C5E|nr:MULTISPECIES: hypothetical protein [unclassified Pseudomonas]NMX66887.1 hypothetical protein [Pseudomonas sp. WS 5111]NMX84951.1 hypothetical protein [Pseudomonas sp. WS 5010]
MADGVFKRLANIFSSSDSQTKGSQVPLYPTSDGKPARNHPPVTAQLRPEAIKNWSHPFKDKSTPLQQLTQLANAAAGSYPLGVGGLWHGGVHFDNGTGVPKDASVRCLADGEVVAYRIDKNSARTVYIVNKLHVMKPYSRNFVLVRHRLEPPAIEGEPKSPPSLFFYSLYMHLQDGTAYEGDLTIARPAFWPESTVRFVPETAKDVRAGPSEQHGLNVRNRSHQGKVLDLLPRGAEVIVSGEGDFRKLENSVGPNYLQNQDGSLLGYLDFDRLESIEGGEYRLKNDLNVHVDATAQSKTIGQKLPAGTQVKISGEGKFRKLEHVTQYVYFKSLQSLRTPQYDRVSVLDEPIPIKAGELIGHIGWYQNYAADKPEKKLHLEVFSEEDMEKFIKDCQCWAKNLPDTSKTWLKLVKGTPVVAHQDHFSTKQLPTLSTADAVSGADLLIPKSLLDSLPTAEKITVPATAGHKAYNWYRLNQLLNDADNKLLSGWVCEEVGITPWVSPWEWQGYAVITDYTSAPAFMAAFLRSLKRFTDQQLQRYGALADAGDSGPIKERLCHIIDRDGNKKMTAEEIQAAIRIPAQAQSISQLIICCESEWYYKPQKWDGLDEMFGHGGSTPHTNWLAEKERIKQLSWWEEVADRVGLPADGKVHHLHAIGLLGNFYAAVEWGRLTVRSGQVTFDAEGNDLADSLYFSRKLHWPAGKSGVTLGRGYDMRHRTRSQVYSQLIEAGFDSAAAENFSLGATLSGPSAQAFVKQNRDVFGAISHQEQIVLFEEVLYPAYEAAAVRRYESVAVQNSPKWNELNERIRDVAVDFTYHQGSIWSRQLPYFSGNDPESLARYIEETPELAQYEKGRQRARYLRGGK